MRKISLLLSLLLACSDPPPEEESPELGVSTDMSISGGDQALPPDGNPSPDLGPHPDTGLDRGSSGDLGRMDRRVLSDQDLVQDQGLRPDALPVWDELVAVIALSQVQDAPEENQASFFVVPQSELPVTSGCTVQHVDADSQENPLSSGNAGRVSIQGLSGGELLMNFQGDRYLPNRGLEPLFSGGAALNATAMGGVDFPAFSIDLTAPQLVQIQSPSNGDNQSIGRDMDIRWTAGLAESLLITIIPTDFQFSPVSGSWVFCGVEDTGQYSLSSQHFRGLLNNPMGQFVLVVITRTRVSEAEVQGLPVVFTATTTGGVGITLVY